MKLYYDSLKSREYLGDVETRSEALSIIYKLWTSLDKKIHILIVDKDEEGRTVIIIDKEYKYVLEED